MSGESCSECDGYEVVIVDGEEVHCATCSLRAEVERLRADLAAERAEVVRLESQVRMLAGLSRRLLLAGDALAEVVDDWPELVVAWQEARS